MNSNNPKEKTLAQYEIEGEKIIKAMLDIITKAQAKVDSKDYNKALKKIK